MKKLIRQALDLYDKQVALSNSKIQELENSLLIAKSQLNTTRKLLEISESKRLQLVKQLDTNQYKETK
jgi:hypothetical protein